jgi:hypothetical protein
MLPLLTFASGLVAGIVGLRLLKNVKTPEGLKATAGSLGDKARHGIDQAQSSLRQATVSSLTAIEASSASLRAKLAPESATPTPEARPARRKAKSTPEIATAAKPAAKRRPKAKPAEPETGADS